MEPQYHHNLPNLRPRLRVDRENPPPLTVEDLIKIDLSFYYFCRRILPYSFEDGFIDGEFVESICAFMEGHRKTIRISAKDHFKSTSFKAHFMWRLFRLSFRSVEDQYFSYEEGMAAYHTAKVKEMVRVNPYFANCRDLKKAAESVLSYTWDGIHTHTLEPHGMLSFKRGIHTGPYGCVYVDDALKDPENKLVLTKIKVVNDVFESQIVDMPDPTTGELHVVGTPQTNEDFFFNKDITRRFGIRILPAIVNRTTREALWPEYMPFDELIERERERPRIFPQEYLCKPGYAKDSYLNEESLGSVIIPSLENWSPFDMMKEEQSALLQYEVIGAIDIGKKAHPSHFVVFVRVPLRNENNIPTGQFRIRQLHSKWMDRWDYTNGMMNPDPETNFSPDLPTQIEYVKLCIQKWRLDRLYFDATRGEWEGFLEQGVIQPGVFIPVVFGTKSKTAMAQTLDKRVVSKEVELLNDERQRTQMLGVLNDLKAIEGPQGHGDSFWSIGMALEGFEEAGGTRAFGQKAEGF